MKSVSFNTIHFEKSVDASVEKCAAAFRTSRALSAWWDRKTVQSAFKVGGKAKAEFLPGFEIGAIVKNQLIVHHYTTAIDGFGLWSFVSKGGKTLIILDHIAQGNQDDECASRCYYWRGLLENLAAHVEGRRRPFGYGQYEVDRLPKGVRYASCEEFMKAWRKDKSIRP